MEVTSGPWEWNPSERKAEGLHTPTGQVPLPGPGLVSLNTPNNNGPPMFAPGPPARSYEDIGSSAAGGPWGSNIGGGTIGAAGMTINNNTETGAQQRHLSQPPQKPANDTVGEGEPPLLEELGINPHEIKKRLKGVLLLHEVREEYLRQCDMTGPCCVLIVLALSLLLTGRMHISHMYSLGIGGSIGMYLLLNLMSQSSFIDLYTTISILGYSLLPVAICGLLRIFLQLRSRWWGMAICLVLTLWSTATSSRFFETVLHLQSQRFLVAYPLFLFYSAFVLLVIL